MIFLIENGRLGNQLFQYSGLKKLFPSQKLYIIGCSDLRRYFTRLDAIFLPSCFCAPFIRYLLLLLAKYRIICTITDCTNSDSPGFRTKPGLFSSIFITKSFFCQTSFIANDIQPDFQLSQLGQSFVDKAHSYLFSKGINLADSKLVFINIRRGDYLYWPNKKSPAVLPLNWYKSSLIYIKQRIPNIVFIVVTDDYFYATDMFEESPNLLISDNPPEIDFALMTLCHSGILSPSTFAWWGAYFSRSNGSEGSLFLAPNYWCGHRKKTWFPNNFKTNWITYLD